MNIRKKKEFLQQQIKFAEDTKTYALGVIYERKNTNQPYESYSNYEKIVTSQQAIIDAVLEEFEGLKNEEYKD